MKNEGNFRNKFDRKEFYTFKKGNRWIPCGKCDGGKHKVIADGREFWYDCEECGEDKESFTIGKLELSNVGGDWVHLWWNQTSWIIDRDFPYFYTKEETIDYLTKRGDIVVENIRGTFVKIN